MGARRPAITPAKIKTMVLIGVLLSLLHSARRQGA
jgi:hypothetical protein